MYFILLEAIGKDIISLISEKHLKTFKTYNHQGIHIKTVLRCTTPEILPRSIKDKTVYSGKHVGYGEHSYFGYGTVIMEINIVVSQKTYLSYLKIPLNQSLN